MASPLITFLLFIILLFSHIVDASRVKRRLFTPNADYTYPSSSTLPHTSYDTTSTHPNPTTPTVYYANHNTNTYPSSSTLPHTSYDTPSTHPNPTPTTVYYANPNTLPYQLDAPLTYGKTFPYGRVAPSSSSSIGHTHPLEDYGKTFPYGRVAPSSTSGIGHTHPLEDYGKTFPSGRVAPSSTSGISHTQPLEDSTPNSLSEESSSDAPLQNTPHNLQESPFYASSHPNPLDRNYLHHVQMDFPTNFNPHSTSTGSIPTRDAATHQPFSKSSAMRDPPLYESSPLNDHDVTTYGEVNVP